MRRCLSNEPKDLCYYDTAIKYRLGSGCQVGILDCACERAISVPVTLDMMNPICCRHDNLICGSSSAGLHTSRILSVN